MLLVNLEQRYNMEQISSLLATILQESQDSNTYCNQGIPRPSQEGATEPPERIMANAPMSASMKPPPAENSDADRTAISEALDSRYSTNTARQEDDDHKNSSQEQDARSNSESRRESQHFEMGSVDQSVEDESATNHSEGCIDLFRFNLRRLWEKLHRIA